MNVSHLLEQPYVYCFVGYLSAAIGVSIAQQTIIKRWLPEDKAVLLAAANSNKSSKSGKSSSVDKSLDVLRPAEFAYLMRNGQLTHCLAVLALDLTQRSLKSQLQQLNKIVRRAKGEISAENEIAEIIQATEMSGLTGIAETSEHSDATRPPLAGTDKVTDAHAVPITCFPPAIVPNQSANELNVVTPRSDDFFDDESFELTESVDQSSQPAYETGMLKLVKERIRNWAAEQVSSFMVENFQKDPLAYTKRIVRIYNFFRDTLGSYVVQLAQDPLQLRHYFTVQGTLLLIAEFTTSGYKQLFEEQLQADLFARGLLVSVDHRRQMAKLCFALSWAAILIASVSFIFLVGLSLHTVVLFLVAFAATFAARFVYGFKDILPYLGNLVQILRFLRRRSWRVFLLRFVSRYLRMMIVMACLTIYVVPMVVVFYVMRFVSSPISRHELLLCCAFSVLILSAINIGFRGLQILREEYATTRGLKLIRDTRRKIAKLSPLESFVQMLQSKTYDQTFSNLVALYGIETLLFLA